MNLQIQVQTLNNAMHPRLNLDIMKHFEKHSHAEFDIIICFSNSTALCNNCGNSTQKNLCRQISLSF